MKHFELKGQIRQVGNKAVIKAFRRQGLVPCNLYGQGLDNVLFTVNDRDLQGLLNTPASYIVDLVLDGKTYTAVVHELQFHPVKDNCLHVDFLAVNEEKPIAINVPLTISGHSVGVQQGGKFIQGVRSLKVSALMANLPDELPVDISELGLGQRIVASDLHYENVNIISPKDTISCSVKATRASATTAAEEAAE